jgi:hypothetical protein
MGTFSASCIVRPAGKSSPRFLGQSIAALPLCRPTTRDVRDNRDVVPFVPVDGTGHTPKGCPCPSGCPLGGRLSEPDILGPIDLTHAN